jgi:hypothetical protein
MEPETIAFVEDWWADLFGCSRDEMWSGVHVGRHAKLAGCPGSFLAWRSTGVHVSLPSSFGDEEAETLAAQGLSSLVDDESWRVWAGNQGLTPIGPSVHAYPRRGPRSRPRLVA